MRRVKLFVLAFTFTHLIACSSDEGPANSEDVGDNGDMATDVSDLVPKTLYCFLLDTNAPKLCQLGRDRIRFVGDYEVPSFITPSIASTNYLSPEADCATVVDDRDAVIVNDLTARGWTPIPQQLPACMGGIDMGVDMNTDDMDTD